MSSNTNDENMATERPCPTTCSAASNEDTAYADALTKAIRDVLQFVKLGEYPDSCVVGNPHCDCEKGEYCKVLP